MKVRLTKIIIDNYDAIISSSTSIATLLIILSGLGRYRVIAVFFVFFLLKAIFSKFKFSSTGLYVLLLPSIIIVLPLDIRYGQYMPLFPHLHYAISIIILIVTEFFVRGITIKMLQNITSDKIFRVCPECMYDNGKIVDHCTSCNYKVSSTTSSIKTGSRISPQKIGNEIKKEIDKNRKLGLLKNPSYKMLNMLFLEEDEFILINIKIFPNRSFFLNGIRKLGGHFVMTTKRIIFIGFSLIRDGWRFKESIYYNQLSDIRVEMKKLVTKKEPVIVIKTVNNIYELYFKSILPFRDKINGIIECLRTKISKNKPISIDLPENQYKINLEW